MFLLTHLPASGNALTCVSRCTYLRQMLLRLIKMAEAKSSGPSQAWSFGLKLSPLGVGESLLKTNRLNIYLKYLCMITFN